MPKLDAYAESLVQDLKIPKERVMKALSGE
jgi:hypothetical protein